MLYMCPHTGVLSYRGHRVKSECAVGPHTASQNPPAHFADVPRGVPFGGGGMGTGGVMMQVLRHY